MAVVRLESAGGALKTCPTFDPTVSKSPRRTFAITLQYTPISPVLFICPALLSSTLRRLVLVMEIDEGDMTDFKQNIPYFSMQMSVDS